MDERIGVLLKRVQSGLRGAMDEALGKKGLTTPQYAALSALEREPGMSNADLARVSFVTPQTMIRIVENLEQLGLVARQPHSTHGKVITTELTPAGARLVTACHLAVGPVEARLVGKLKASERASLQALLKKCVEGIES